MTDRRFYPANIRVAARSLAGSVSGIALVDGTAMTVSVPVADLCIAPDGPRDRQLLLGAKVTQLEDHAGWSFVQAADGYVGYLISTSLTAHSVPTHRIATFATHTYASEDFKSADQMSLPFGAQVAVEDERRKFYETAQGFIPKSHLRPLDRPFTDPATIAQLHFGVPYLWGGNSTRGIDCSGLIAAALCACDITCPADSDLQCAKLGKNLPDGAELHRGDLIFWLGHAGMMVDPATMIHANAHHMATAYEPVSRAIARIAAQGDGDVVARIRIT